MRESTNMRRITAIILAALMTGLPGVPIAAAQQAASDGTFTLKVQSDIVLTNVVVRDKKTGAVVKGLTAGDFTVLENGKSQKVKLRLSERG